MFSASCLTISTPSHLWAYIAILDRECVLQTGLHHLKELRVVAVVADVVEDVLVGDDVESAEDNDDRDILPDVRDGRADRLAGLPVGVHESAGGAKKGARLATPATHLPLCPSHHLDLQRRDGLATLFDG